MAVNIGPKVELDGWKEFRKDMNNMIQQQKTLASEMKAVTATFNENTSAQEKAQATARILSDQVSTQQKRVEKLTEWLNKAKAEFGENDSRTLQWKQAVFEATAQLTKMENEIEKNTAIMNGSTSAADKYKEAMDALDNSTLTMQLKLLKSELELTESAFKKTTSAKKKAKAAAKSLSDQIIVQKEKVKELEKALHAAEKAYGADSREVMELRTSLNRAKTELNQMGKELKEATTQSSLFRSALSKAGAGLKDLSVKAVKGLGPALGNGLKKTIKGATKTIGSLTAAAGAAVVALGKIGLDYNMEMESYTTNFETMLGSAAKAEAKVESLKQMAASTPFEMTDLADATQQLLAMGVASEDTNKYLQQLGDISLGNTEKFNSLIGAFGKMNSSGKVTLEYINIMAEQGFNPLNLIAEKTGETMAEVYARVSDGAVTFDEVKNAMAAATSAGGQFYQGMEKASQTTAGRIATLKDNATALVGEVFEPISEGLSNELLPAAISAVDELSTAFKENGVNGMVAAAGDIVGETIASFALSLPEFANTAVGIVDSLMQGLKNNLGTIADGASTAVLTLADGIIDLLPELIVTGTLLIGKLAAGIIKGLPDLIAQIPSMIEEIVTGFGEHGEEWKQIGLDIVNGIWDSLRNYWGNFTEWFDGAWDDLVGGVKELLGIHSPSRVFGNIAKNMALGAEDGWFKTFGGINKDIQNSMNFDAGYVTMRPSMAPAMATVGTGSAISYGGFTFNIYAQPGQDANAIADVVLEKIQTEVERKGAAW